MNALKKKNELLRGHSNTVKEGDVVKIMLNNGLGRQKKNGTRRTLYSNTTRK